MEVDVEAVVQVQPDDSLLLLTAEMEVEDVGGSEEDEDVGDSDEDEDGLNPSG